MSRIIRFQFIKGHEVRFLSHLDLVRTMERALRRARLPIAYSGGFTPRPIMSFGFALPVGVLSIAEYGDFEFLEELDPAEFLTVYNRHLPKGFKVVKAELLPDGTPALMREINAASYQLNLPHKNAEEITKRWQWLQSVDTFVIERQTKKGSRELDIRPFLHTVSQITSQPGGTMINCLCSLGNEANLRMEELGALLDFALFEATITRTGQLIKTGHHYRSPLGNRG